MLALNQQQTHAIHTWPARAYGSGEVVTPHTVGNPLLLAIDDIVLTILAQLRLARQVRNVRACIGLSNGQADTLVTIQNARQNSVLEALLAKLDQRRAADAKSTNDVPDKPAGANAGDLIGDEHLVEEIPVLGRNGFVAVVNIVLLVGGAEQAGQVTTTAHLLVDCRRDLLLLVPLGHVGLDLVVDPFADLGAESSVGLGEVRRMELSGICCQLDALVVQPEIEKRAE